MDDKIQKERLEQELSFLKESFEADVISKEEYEKGKERIEKKLNEFGNAKIKADKPEFLPDEPKEEKETIRLKMIQDSPPEEHGNNGQIPKEKQSEPAEFMGEKDKSETEERKKQGKSKGKFLKYSIVFIILILMIFFSYSLSRGYTSKPDGKKTEGKIFRNEAAKLDVTILNNRKNCFNCNTDRVLNILETWFGAINAKEIEQNTEEGRKLAEKLNARLLPVYIFTHDITKNENYENIKQAFIKKNDSYVLSEDAAGSTFYFKRDAVPDRLDLFALQYDNSSIRAENNLKEFLETFKEAKFEKHFSDDKLAKELGIKTFPTFLVNNEVKFSGVHSAETIKENFCRMNKLENCGKKLSERLV